MPSKPAKYGIKTWVACDARSSYAWKMQIYTGRSAEGRPEKNQGARVVLDLTEGLGRGRNVTCDNFFTSYALGRSLLERGLTVVGTVRKNKPELPPALVACKGRPAPSSAFAFTAAAALVSYVPKKNRNVLLLSTKRSHVLARGGGRAGGDGKPAVVLDYNRNKGGVDNLDKVIGTYSCRRMTVRWPLVVFHNMIDVSCYNAFVVWRELNPDWMSSRRNRRRVFLERLGKALVTPLIERRAHLPRTEASASVVRAVRLGRKKRKEERAGGGGGGGDGDGDGDGEGEGDGDGDGEGEGDGEGDGEGGGGGEGGDDRDPGRDRDRDHRRHGCGCGLGRCDAPPTRRAPPSALTRASTEAPRTGAPTGAPSAPSARKRKRCQSCPPKKDSKTSTLCRGCGKYVCRGCALVYCSSCVETDVA